MKKIILLFGILLLLSSCGEERINRAEENQTLYFNEAAALSKRAMAAGDPVADYNSGQKIIRNAYLEFEVRQMDSSLVRIRRLIQEQEAFIQSENQYQSGERLYYSLTLRVPAAHFDTFLDKLLQGGDIRRLNEKNISSRDVTEQFIDIEARLSVQRQALERYRKLLEKAETVADIINVEENIRRLQAEIESQEQRLLYLSRQVEMSEIRINLYESRTQDYIPDKPAAFAPQFLKALHSGWKGLVWIFFWIMRLWPLWLIIIIPLIRNRIARKRNK